MELVREIPRDLHRRAELRRILARGLAQQYRDNGAPEEWIKKQIALDLAIADLVDAIASPKRGRYKQV